MIPRNSRRRSRNETARAISEVLEARVLLATIPWDGGPTGNGTNWSDAVNWVGDVKPGAGDDAVINTSGPTILFNQNETVQSVVSSRQVSLSSATFTINAASQFSDLTLTGGTLNGSGNVTITNTLSWSGGTMSGAGKTILASGATANLSGINQKVLGRVMENAGTTNYLTPAINFGGNNGTFSNLAGATFNLSAADTFVNYSNNNLFTNAGTLNKGGASSYYAFQNVTFNNLDTGIVNVDAGTLAISNPGTNDGLFDVDSGALLQFNTTYTHAVDSNLTGTGTVNLASGTHTFPAGALLSSGLSFAPLNSATMTLDRPQDFANLTLTGGTLNGSGNVTITNTLNYSGGRLEGSGVLTLPQGATANFSNGLQFQRTVNNSGTINLSSGGQIGGYGVLGGWTVNNLATGVFNASGETGFYNNSDPNTGQVKPGTFVNTGTFNRSGAGTTTFNVPFTNNGTASITAGTLTLQAGGTNTGSLIINGTLQAGSLPFSGGSRLAGEPTGLVVLTGNLTGDTTNSDQYGLQGTLRFSGSGTKQLEVMSRGLGNIATAYTKNFAYGTVELVAGTNLTLVNNSDNVPGAEAGQSHVQTSAMFGAR